MIQQVKSYLYQQNINNKDDFAFLNGLSNYYNKKYKKSLKNFNNSNKVAKRWRLGGFTYYSNAYYLTKTLYLLKRPYENLMNEGISYYESIISNGADASGILFQLSALYALKNDNSKSLDLLEKAVENGYRNKILLMDSAFDSVRNQDRFKLAVSEIDIFIQREKIKFKQSGLIPSI